MARYLVSEDFSARIRDALSKGEFYGHLRIFHPYSLRCDFCMVKLDAIIKQETFGQDLAYLQSIFGLEVQGYYFKLLQKIVQLVDALLPICTQGFGQVDLESHVKGKINDTVLLSAAPGDREGPLPVLPEGASAN